MVNIAIIGAGQIGSRHLQALSQLNRLTNIQIVDPNYKSLERARERFLQVQKNKNIQKVKYLKNVVLLQPTSPLRTVEDIDGCIEKCIYNKVNACVSVTESDKSSYWMYSLDDKDQMVPLLDKEE